MKHVREAKSSSSTIFVVFQPVATETLPISNSLQDGVLPRLLSRDVRLCAQFGASCCTMVPMTDDEDEDTTIRYTHRVENGQKRSLRFVNAVTNYFSYSHVKNDTATPGQVRIPSDAHRFCVSCSHSLSSAHLYWDHGSLHSRSVNA